MKSLFKNKTILRLWQNHTNQARIVQVHFKSNVYVSGIYAAGPCVIYSRLLVFDKRATRALKRHSRAEIMFGK